MRINILPSVLELFYKNKITLNKKSATINKI